MRILVTGGAGFVGSHIVLALRDAGHAAAVIDNLSNGHRAAVPEGVPLIEADLGHEPALDEVLAQGPWDGVVHCAGLISVGESMEKPFLYFAENTAVANRLIGACARHGVRRIVFSSTAAVYSPDATQPLDENQPLAPASVYGESKRMTERILDWGARQCGLSVGSLRYFNASGADPAGRAGEDHRPETHLIPLAIDAALGRRPPLAVFGADWPTPDGTCIRDYIHVADLAAAHLATLARLEHGSLTANVGTGAGHSVQAVIETVEAVTGRPVPRQMAPRRPGDAPVLVASPARLKRETGWAPRFAALGDIVAHAYAWRLAHPDGYRTAGTPAREPATAR